MDELVRVSPPGERMLTRAAGLIVCVFAFWSFLAPFEHRDHVTGIAAGAPPARSDAGSAGSDSRRAPGAGHVLFRLDAPSSKVDLLRPGTAVVAVSRSKPAARLPGGRIVEILPLEREESASRAYGVLVEFPDAPPVSDGERVSLWVPAGKQSLLRFLFNLIPQG